jgi:hypothetical protein
MGTKDHPKRANWRAWTEAAWTMTLNPYFYLRAVFNRDVALARVCCAMKLLPLSESFFRFWLSGHIAQAVEELLDLFRQPGEVPASCGCQSGLFQFYGLHGLLEGFQDSEKLAGEGASAFELSFGFAVVVLAGPLL